MKTPWLVLSLAAAALAEAGCSTDDCPAGTWRVEGRCVIVSDEADGGAAGDGDADSDADADADADSDGEADGDGDGDGDDCIPVRHYRDADGDGWGTVESILACGPQDGWALRSGDCDDAIDATHPGVPEVCNGIDDDCANGPDDPFACVPDSVSACETECATAGTSTCGATCKPGPCVPPAERHADRRVDGLQLGGRVHRRSG